MLEIGRLNANLCKTPMENTLRQLRTDIPGYWNYFIGRRLSTQAGTKFLIGLTKAASYSDFTY